MRLGILIMAAGKGTRLKSKRAKVLHEIGGRPLLQHVTAAAAQVVSPQDIYAIVGHQADAVQAAVRATGVHFIVQPEQRGTGHAVQIAERGDARVRRADRFVGGCAAAAAGNDSGAAGLSHSRAGGDDHFVGCAGRSIRLRAHCAEEGRLPRRLLRIVEQKALTPAQQRIREINSGIYAFGRRRSLRHIGQLRDDNAHKELYLTDMARIWWTRASAWWPWWRPGHGGSWANTIAEMMELDRELRMATARRLMARG